MSVRFDPSRAEVLLNYHFANPELLRAALTHPSAAEGSGILHSYERLEFLGDSILGDIVAREAFQRFPKMDEGGLTRIKSSLVSGQSLSPLAKTLGLEEVIIFGHSETGTGKRGMKSALENVYEAIVAAIYLDGGFDAASAFVHATLLPKMDEGMATPPENPKNTLQERLQEHHITPTYALVSTDGPPHDRTFLVEVLAGNISLAKGSGRSKKEAEARAAAKALQNYKKTLALALSGVTGKATETVPEASQTADGGM